MHRTLVLACSLLAATAQAGSGAISEEWRIQSVNRAKEKSEGLGEYERVSVQFSNGHTYEIPLYRARPIAVLRGSDGTPFLLAAGADCIECDENNTLRFFALGNKEMKGSGKRHAYPGSLSDYMSSRLLEKTRTFYGHCLSEPNDVVLWFQEYFGEDGKWHKRNSVARMTKDGDTLVELIGKEAALSSAVARVKDGTCTELPGIDGKIEP